MLDSLLSVASASPWAYSVLFLLVLLDVVFPPAPGEIALVSSGALAAGGDLSLVLVVLTAAGAAATGDNGMYALGRSLRRVERGRLLPPASSRLPRAEARLRHRAVSAIVLGRFVPFGRTAVTLASGTARLPWSRFALIDLIAAALWAMQGALLGYFGGKALPNPLLAISVGLALALVITGALEAARRRGESGSRAAESVHRPE